QKEALALALARQESFVYVSPTGQGKSLIFMGPPHVEPDYHTYAVIPNKALLDDHVEKAEAAQLSVGRWTVQTAQKHQDPHQLYLLAMESAVNPKFEEFCIFHRDKAARIVIDEAHTILTSAQFRQQCNRMHTLMAIRVQKIALTATLPQRLEAIFLQTLGMSPQTRVLRAPSHQPHVSYIRMRYSARTVNQIELAMRVAETMEAFIGDKRTGVFFCPTKDIANTLSDEFAHCVSHSDIPTDIRREHESDWKKGDSRWIAATTGLIQGIDSPRVGVAIFVGIPYGLVNIYQGAGRTGRDGTPSWAIV
ncbi:P-loop containing nucleoside triphosphate hydrolase protein, partial [Pholiota molesta]